MADNPSSLTLPLLITKGMVLFPSTTRLIEAGRDFSVKAVKVAREKSDSLILITSQNNSDVDKPTPTDVFSVGVLARIISISEKENIAKIRVEVIDRVSLANIAFDAEDECYVSEATMIEAIKVDPQSGEAIVSAINHELEKYPSVLSKLPKYLVNLCADNARALDLCYSFAGYFDASKELKQKLLETNDLILLAETVTGFISGENIKEEIEKNISDSIRESTEKSQKEYYLREKLKAVKKELGEDVGGNNDPDKILEKLDKYPYPENVKAKVKAEIKKYEMMPQGSLEAALILSYLDVIMSIPWWQKTEDNEDLKNVEDILNEDHYGLDNPKKRIVEYLAVKKLTGNLKSPILCFYGPPGTGKTSLGKSIARALGRKFFKCSLGGISDEAEIRGHRRTYVGSLPGRIIQGMRKVGVSNPVFLLDEVDKLASSYKGDPASALLEVLDPEQNHAFHDNFLDIDYDLSKVLFIATANDLNTIPRPLLDRMEIIEVSGYTTEEKIEIAKRHLVPRELKNTGLDTCESKPTFRKASLEKIIEQYTRESGVRQLEKQINKTFRRIAYYKAAGEDKKYDKITTEQVQDILGKPPYYRDIYQGNDYAGVVTGLAWTSVGGEILFIETSLSKGKGAKLTLTGNLGDVMKESAVIALEYVKAHVDKLNIDYKIFEQWNIHIHVPEGATPKDGPSAGITIATSIASALTQRKVRKNTAMTGEITLRGKVLPVGGIKEKILAAKRAGITDIVLCKDNKKDIDEIQPKYITGVTFHYVENIQDVWDFALTNEMVEDAVTFEIEKEKN